MKRRDFITATGALITAGGGLTAASGSAVADSSTHRPQVSAWGHWICSEPFGLIRLSAPPRGPDAVDVYLDGEFYVRLDRGEMVLNEIAVGTYDVTAVPAGADPSASRSLPIRGHGSPVVVPDCKSE